MFSRARDPHARAAGDSERPTRRQEEQRITIERLAVVLAGDCKRLRETPGTRAQQERIVETAPRSHLLDAGVRLERAQENRCARSLTFADDVRAPVNAVRAVHVELAWWAEHCRVALRLTAKGMAGRIFWGVCLGFDDHAAHAAHEERATDERGSRLVDAPGERCPKLCGHSSKSCGC